MWMFTGDDKLWSPKNAGGLLRPVASWAIGPLSFGVFASNKKSWIPGGSEMKKTSSSAQTFHFRFAQVIAVSGVIAIAACQDATAPDQVEQAAPNSLRLTQNSADELGSLSSSLDDMTGWSLAALPDGTGKTNIVGLLNGLKGHLASGKIAACQQDLDDARAWFGSLDTNQQTEIGAVGVTLDRIQAALNNASSQ